MITTIKTWFSTENRAAFWLHMTITAAVLWGLGGLLAALSPGSAPAAVLAGFSSCWILASGLLCLGERRGRETPRGLQNTMEWLLLGLMAALQLLSEVLALAAGTVSYGPVVTLGCLAVVFCVWIAGPRLTRHQRCTTPEILKILVLGIAACVLLARFTAMAGIVLAG